MRNLPEIAQQLGVAHLLEGSVQRSGNRVRVNAQLIATSTGSHEWAETYDRELADVFAIQSEIATAIAQQLQAKMSPGEKAALGAAPTTDLLANALYQQAKGMELTEPLGSQTLLEAVRLLDQAVARDPQFVLAYCLLGRVHTSLFIGSIAARPSASSRRWLCRMLPGSSPTPDKSTAPGPIMLTTVFSITIALVPNWISPDARFPTMPKSIISPPSSTAVRAAGPRRPGISSAPSSSTLVIFSIVLRPADSTMHSAAIPNAAGCGAAAFESNPATSVPASFARACPLTSEQTLGRCGRSCLRFWRKNLRTRERSPRIWCVARSPNGIQPPPLALWMQSQPKE